MTTLSLARKALTVATTTMMLAVCLAGQATALDGATFFNRATQSCMTVSPNSTAGSPVLLGACGTAAATWHLVGGPDSRVQNEVNGLCVEVPPGGGYAFLQTCGGTMQSLDITTPGMILVWHDTDSRVLEADVATARVRSAEITGEQNQSWAFH